MINYKCMECGKKIKDEYIKKKIRCPHCGSKVVYKARTITTKVRAI